jgi:hypothetical protein
MNRFKQFFEILKWIKSTFKHAPNVPTPPSPEAQKQWAEEHTKRIKQFSSELVSSCYHQGRCPWLMSIVAPRPNIVPKGQLEISQPQGGWIKCQKTIYVLKGRWKIRCLQPI